MKKIILISTVVLALAIFIGWRFVYFGSLTRNCIYTEEKLSVPKELAEGKLVTTQTAYEFIGLEDKEMSCSPINANIARELISPENKTTYEGFGMTIKEIPVGKVFHVIDAFTQTKHGISTIDSGPGPIELLILQDEQGTHYTISPAGFGINKEGRFLKFVSGEKEQLLDSSAFYQIGADGKTTGFSGIKYFHLGNIDAQKQDLPSVSYDTMRGWCGSSSCCKNSVSYMEKNGYKLSQAGCSNGFKQNRNSCSDSMVWCEPK